MPPADRRGRWSDGARNRCWGAALVIFVAAVSVGVPPASPEDAARDAQPAREQEEFVRLFTELLERSYLSTIENYAGERVTFLGESINGSYAQVRSRITTDRKVEISIDYRLIEKGDRWTVYDVVLDGVSLVSNYRSQFNSIIRTSSFADLLTKLRNKEIAAHVVPRIGRGGS